MKAFAEFGHESSCPRSSSFVLLDYFVIKL